MANKPARESRLDVTGSTPKPTALLDLLECNEVAAADDNQDSDVRPVTERDGLPHAGTHGWGEDAKGGVLATLLRSVPLATLPDHLMPAKGWVQSVAEHAWDLVPAAERPTDPATGPAPSVGAGVPTPAPGRSWAIWWIGRVHAALNQRRPVPADPFGAQSPFSGALNGLDKLGNFTPPRLPDGSCDTEWPHGEYNLDDTNPFTGGNEILFTGWTAGRKGKSGEDSLPLRLIVEYTANCARTLQAAILPYLPDSLRRAADAVDPRTIEREVAKAVQAVNVGNHSGIGDKGRNWKEVQADLVAKMERKEPYSSLRKLCAELKCSDATIGKAIRKSETLKGWRARTGKAKSAPKAMPLGAAVKDNAQQTTEAAPDQFLPKDDVDVAMAQLIDKAQPEERAKLHELDDAGRRELVAKYHEHNMDAEPSPLKPDNPDGSHRTVRHYKRV